MEKKDARFFAGLMDDFLNIPSYICEAIEINLINGHYLKVLNFIVERKRAQKEEDKHEEEKEHNYYS